jgi:hypothetical protein
LKVKILLGAIALMACAISYFVGVHSAPLWMAGHMVAGLATPVPEQMTFDTSDHIKKRSWVESFHMMPYASIDGTVSSVGWVDSVQWGAPGVATVFVKGDQDSAGQIGSADSFGEDFAIASGATKRSQFNVTFRKSETGALIATYGPKGIRLPGKR